MHLTEPDPPTLLRISELAGLLRCHRSTVYRHHRSDPAFPRIRRICGHAVVKKSDFIQWMEKNHGF